jgi:hypothetical protein
MCCKNSLPARKCNGIDRRFGYNRRSSSMHTVLVLDHDRGVRDTIGVMLETGVDARGISTPCVEGAIVFSLRCA